MPPPIRMFPRAFCLALLSLASVPLFAADEPQIVFVHLYYKDGAYTLTKTNTIAGTLKEKRGGLETGTIQYEARSSAGATVASGSMPDPLLRRICYPDPANPGQMKNHVVKLDEAEVVVRVPFNKDLKSLDLYRAAPANVAGLRNAVGGRVLAGSIDLSAVKAEGAQK